LARSSCCFSVIYYSILWRAKKRTTSSRSSAPGGSESEASEFVALKLRRYPPDIAFLALYTTDSATACTNGHRAREATRPDPLEPPISSVGERFGGLVASTRCMYFLFSGAPCSAKGGLSLQRNPSDTSLLALHTTDSAPACTNVHPAREATNAAPLGEVLGGCMDRPAWTSLALMRGAGIPESTLVALICDLSRDRTRRFDGNAACARAAIMGRTPPKAARLPWELLR
jgi:hypothetical protein